MPCGKTTGPTPNCGSSGSGGYREAAEASEAWSEAALAEPRAERKRKDAEDAKSSACTEVVRSNCRRLFVGLEKRRSDGGLSAVRARTLSCPDDPRESDALGRMEWHVTGVTRSRSFQAGSVYRKGPKPWEGGIMRVWLVDRLKWHLYLSVSTIGII